MYVLASLIVRWFPSPNFLSTWYGPLCGPKKKIPLWNSHLKWLGDGQKKITYHPLWPYGGSKSKVSKNCAKVPSSVHPVGIFGILVLDCRKLFRQQIILTLSVPIVPELQGLSQSTASLLMNHFLFETTKTYNISVTQGFHKHSHGIILF